MISTTGLFTLLLASSALTVNGVVLPRAVSCPAFQTSFSALSANQQSAVNAFCTKWLALVPKTITSTQTNVVKTIKNTIQHTNTVTNTVTPATSTATVTNKETDRVTNTLATSTVDADVTSTAYVDNEGNTITIMKRDLLPTPVQLAERALATPALLAGLSRVDMSASCSCLGLVASTITHKTTKQATSTSNIVKTKTAFAAITVAVPIATITVTSTRLVTITAAAPLATAFTTVFDDEATCWPGTNQTFLCPEGTGDDDGTLSAEDQLNCATVSGDGDGFSGDCNYWADDGSPVGSELSSDDGDGNISYRAAVYSDDDNADCPSWADYTCAPTDSGDSTPSKRFFGGFDESSPSKRWFELNEMSKRAAEDKTGLTARAKSHKKKKMPKHLKHGAAYVPYSIAKDKIAQ